MTDATKRAYAASPDEGERERLLVEQLPQVRFIARRIHDRLPRHVPLEDMVHAGVVGLIHALHKFDGSKHVQFGAMPSSASAGQFLTVCAKWTGVRAICGAKPGGWRRRTTHCAPAWDAIPANLSWRRRHRLARSAVAAGRDLRP